MSHPSALIQCPGWVIDAALAAGLPLNEDLTALNKKGSAGIKLWLLGATQSAAYCFLRPALRRLNLTVLTNMSPSGAIHGRKATALAVIDLVVNR